MSCWPGTLGASKLHCDGLQRSLAAIHVQIASFAVAFVVSMQHTASFSTLNTSAGVQRRLVSRSASPAQQLRCGRQARIERRLVARAEVEQAAAAAATSSGEFSDSEVRHRSF